MRLELLAVRKNYRSIPDIDCMFDHIVSCMMLETARCCFAVAVPVHTPFLWAAGKSGQTPEAERKVVDIKERIKVAEWRFKKLIGEQ